MLLYRNATEAVRECYGRMRIAARPLLLWISTASSVASFQSITRQGKIASARALSFRRNLQSLSFTKGRQNEYPSSRSALSMTSTSRTTEESLRVALCQFHVTPNKDQNHETALDFLTRAAEQGAQLAVLPEIWNSPYATAAFPEYSESLPNLGDSEAPGSPSAQLLIKAAKDTSMWIVGDSIPERTTEGEHEKIYNTCLVLNPEGTVVAKHRKVHLFDIDVPGGIRFFESETLSPGQTISHFTSPFGEIGVGICYDIRFAEMAMLMRQKHNCTILIYPGAFNLTTGPAHWELLQRARALDNQCFVVTASPARTLPPSAEEEKLNPSKYPHYTAWGHSTVVSPWGDVVATTDENSNLVIADLDLSKVPEIRRSIPISDQRRSDLYRLEQQS